ncbi:MAG: glycosyltransferase family 39 protein [Verrucomicrobiota bacterium]
MPAEFGGPGAVPAIHFTPVGFFPRGGPPGDLVPTYPSGLPLQFAAASRLLGWTAGPLLVLVAAALGAVALTYLLGRELGLTPALAATGAALLAVNPVFVFTSLQPLSDTVATTWVLAAAWAAVRARVHRGWALAAGAAFALAVLVRPTNLLLGPAVALLIGRDWRRLLLLAAGGLPGAAWLAGYQHALYGHALASGYGDIFAAFGWQYGAPTARHFGAWLARLLPPVLLGLVVQAGFFLLRWRPEDRWWRVGATFAGLLLFLSTPVWEGYPGAATRVLLPMTLAFNLLVPAGGRWLPVLIAGNLGVLAAVQEFRPPVEFHTLRADPVLEGSVHARPGAGWHGPETLDGHRWRWTAGRAELRVRNDSAGEIRLSFRAQAHPVEGERALRVTLGERLLWGGRLAVSGATEVRFGTALPPGESVRVFSTDQPAQRKGTDPRELAFRLSDVELVAVP